MILPWLAVVSGYVLVLGLLVALVHGLISLAFAPPRNKPARPASYKPSVR